MKSTQRYQSWAFSEAREEGMSFGEWLKEGFYKPLQEDDDCWTCRGTGEGMWEGASCVSCLGTGIAGYKACRKDYDWED